MKRREGVGAMLVESKGGGRGTTGYLSWTEYGMAMCGPGNRKVLVG